MSKKDFPSYLARKLRYQDLCLLLQEDDKIRQLIAKIAQTANAQQQNEDAQRANQADLEKLQAALDNAQKEITDIENQLAQANTLLEQKAKEFDTLTTQHNATKRQLQERQEELETVRTKFKKQLQEKQDELKGAQAQQKEAEEAQIALENKWLPMEGYLKTSQLILEDDALCQLFHLSQSKQDQGRNIILLAALAGQYTNGLESVWKIFQARCKNENRAINDAETNILQQVLAIHNAILSDKNQYELTSPEIGADYDFKQHERIDNEGEQIRAILLPGLRKKGDTKSDNKPLVKTDAI